MAAIRKIKDVVVALCILALGLLIAAKLDQGTEQRFSGPFSVVDGDTLSAGGERLRLDGVDAPEIDQTCERTGKTWPCGLVAREELRALVKADGLVCMAESRDKYGRLLVLCQGSAGDPGAALVRQGMAVAFGRYAAEQGEARAARRGLWDGTFERPQDFRKRRDDEGDGDTDSWLSALLAWISNTL